MKINLRKTRARLFREFKDLFISIKNRLWKTKQSKTKRQPKSKRKVVKKPKR